MKYSIENIDTQNKFLFFWGHQPTKDGSISKSCFSQWWKSPFSLHDNTYTSAEHFMMAKKAELFDPEMITKILIAKSPAEAKKLGRQIKNYDEETWLKHRFDIVKEANFQKFNQHPELKNYLLQTGSRILVEASPVDAIWGIGFAAEDPRAHQPIHWRGLNLLGFALMEVRDLLKN